MAGTRSSGVRRRQRQPQLVLANKRGAGASGRNAQPATHPLSLVKSREDGATTTAAATTAAAKAEEPPQTRFSMRGRWSQRWRESVDGAEIGSPPHLLLVFSSEEGAGRGGGIIGLGRRGEITQPRLALPREGDGVGAVVEE
ncbi:hypothetical protein CVT26_015800 [Gymnopilus dilepis]|uniref:Uncharacterized protein n=1 Tax=Gymnopilus dilepis TaxID=231916 RepID=A0A409YDE6_9AGAR|nr:hypothetical protein CVT26_015800 [Gymnopilus dilepis]